LALNSHASSVNDVDSTSPTITLQCLFFVKEYELIVSDTEIITKMAEATKEAHFQFNLVRVTAAKRMKPGKAMIKYRLINIGLTIERLYTRIIGKKSQHTIKAYRQVFIEAPLIVHERISIIIGMKHRKI
jgi:hypothetical protein